MKPLLPIAWLDAWQFAAEVHNSQKMPDADLPYLHHLGRVALIVMAAHQSQAIPDIDLGVSCAILHDCIEDQDATHTDLAQRFGLAVADGVLALSKNSSMPKTEAMTDSLRRIREQPIAVWCVKLADRIANMQTPPAHWTPEKCASYSLEAKAILDALGAANGVLAACLKSSIDAYQVS